jgi:hypothetical protein
MESCKYLKRLVTDDNTHTAKRNFVVNDEQALNHEETRWLTDILCNEPAGASVML